MPISLRVGGALQEASRVRIRVGGSLRNVKRVRVMHDGSLREAFSSGTEMSASASPAGVEGSALSGTIYTNPTTVTPSGGVAPYTYSWALFSTSNGSPSALAPAFATTGFQCALGTGENASAVFRCTVTDSLGATATADVSADFANLSVGP